MLPRGGAAKRSVLLVDCSRDKSPVDEATSSLSLSPTSSTSTDMRGIQHIVTAALVGGVAAHVVQKPLLDSDVHGLGGSKPLVDSKELQSSIDGKALLARAEDLYKLAELSWQYVYHASSSTDQSSSHII